jgi:hypothetical protein
MRRKKERPPAGIVIIGFSAFCTNCASEVRSAEAEDMNGDLIFCPECGMTHEMAVGFSVNANTLAELRQVAQEMKQNLPLVKEILGRRNREGES